MSASGSAPPTRKPLPRRSSSWFPPARLGRRTYFPLGMVLLVALSLVYLTGTTFSGTRELRDLPNYDIASGVVMASYLFAQSFMPMLRARGRVPHRMVIRAHKLLGALGPLFLFVHAEHLGYGYLGALSSVFLASMALGLLNHETLGIRGRMPAFVWMVAHVALSAVLVVLAAVHAYYALSFE